MGVILTASADNTITISSAEGHPGDIVDVTVSMSNTDRISAVQMDYKLGNAVAFVEGSEMLVKERVADHNITATVADGVLRLMIYSLGLKDIASGQGELCKFSLRLAKEPGNFTISPNCILTGTDGKKKDCTITKGNVKIICPKISVLEEKLDFGNKAIRSTYQKVFTIANVGTEDLNVTDISVDNAVFSFNKKNVIVKAGKQESVVLYYSPIARKSDSATISISSNAVNGQQILPIEAYAYSVNELHVLPVSGQSGDEVDVIVSMNNMEDISAVQFSLEMPEGIEFVNGSVKSCRTELSAYSKTDGSRVDVMMYSPMLKNVAEGDANIVTFKVKLNCNGGSYLLQPKNVVLGNSKLENVFSFAEGQYIVVKSPILKYDSSFDLGKCDITIGKELNYYVSNVGNRELVISKVVFFDDNLSTSTSLPLVIPEGETKSIAIDFNPKAEGAFSSLMHLYTDDPACRMAQVSISGNVYAPNVLSIDGAINRSNGSGTLNVALNNYTDVVAVQAELHCADGISIVCKDISKSQRMKNHSVSIISLGNNNYRLIAYNMDSKHIDGHDGDILSVPLSTDKNSLLDGMIITMDNIKLSTDNGKNCASSYYAEYIYTEHQIGDVNDDGKVDIVDIVVLVAYLNESNASPNKYCDINNDGVVNIEDVTVLSNILLHK